MKNVINLAMALVACVLAHGCASNASERNLSSSSNAVATNIVISITNVLREVAWQFPELKSTEPGRSVLPIGTEGGEEWANTVFTLPQNPGYLTVQIARYASPSDAAKAIDKPASQ